MKKENEAIKDRIIRDIRNLFKHEEEDCYEPVRAGNFWSNSYIENESSSDWDKKLSPEEHLHKTRPYLERYHKWSEKSDTWKIQLKIAIKFMSSKDNDEERVMHSKSDNIEIMVNDKAQWVIEDLFESLLIRYGIR